MSECLHQLLHGSFLRFVFDGNEPFAVLLGDTLISSNAPATKQLMDVFDRCNAPVVLIEEIDRSKVERYGVVSGNEVEKGLYKVDDFIEKPTVEEAPSNLAVAGRYILTADIFEYLDTIEPGKNGELQLTDAVRLMLSDRAMYGLRLDGKRHDIGNKQGFIETNIEFALRREDMSQELREYIKRLAKDL